MEYEQRLRSIDYVIRLLGAHCRSDREVFWRTIKGIIEQRVPDTLNNSSSRLRGCMLEFGLQFLVCWAFSNACGKEITQRVTNEGRMCVITAMVFILYLHYEVDPYTVEEKLKKLGFVARFLIARVRKSAAAEVGIAAGS